MSEVSSISAGRLERLEPISTTGTTPGRSASAANVAQRPGDQVEVSTLATYMNKLRNLPIRQQLVDDVREQIARGTYDTPEKIDATINELLPEL